MIAKYDDDNYTMTDSAEVKRMSMVCESCDFCGCRRAMDTVRAVKRSPSITMK